MISWMRGDMLGQSFIAAEISLPVSPSDSEEASHTARAAAFSGEAPRPSLVRLTWA